MFEEEEISLQLENGDHFPLENNGWLMQWMTPQDNLEVRGTAMIKFISIPESLNPTGVYEGSSLL